MIVERLGMMIGNRFRGDRYLARHLQCITSFKSLKTQSHNSYKVATRWLIGLASITLIIWYFNLYTLEFTRKMLFYTGILILMAMVFINENK